LRHSIPDHVWRSPRLIGPVAITYFALGWLGLHSPVPPGFVTLIWPASGLALAAVLLAGERVWPGIWLAALSVNLLTVAQTTGQLTPWLAGVCALIACGNTVEAVVAGRLLRHLCPTARWLDEPMDALWLALVAAGTCTVAATVGVSSLLVAGLLPLSQGGFTWLVWWLGDAAGVLITAPLLLRWLSPERCESIPARRTEAWLFVGVTALVIGLLLSQKPGRAPPLLYPVMLCQLWAAVRLGITWTATVNAVIAVLMLLPTTMGLGVFAAYASPEALMFLQGFIATCAVMALVVAAAAAAYRRVSDDLQQRTLTLNHVMDNVGAIIFFKDVAGRYLLVNHRFEALVGRTQAEILGQRDEDLFPAEAAAVFQRHDALALAAERPLLVEETLPGPLGTHTYLTAKIPVRRADGSLEGVCGVATDITERQQGEVQRQRIAALQQADVLKNQFLSVLSHELRTPLTVIAGYTAILDREIPGTLNATQHQYLQKVQLATNGMLRLISELLDMSRILAGTFRVQPEPLDPAAAVAAAVSTLAILAEQKGLTLTSAIPADTPWVAADPLRFGQVLSNLIGNAIKFTPAGGRVWLTAVPLATSLRLEVSDDGPGIPAEQQHLLFSRFSQLDMSPTRRAGGLGLGLNICREIVLAHGGTIGVDSHPGTGSTFWFTLPLAAAKPEPLPSTAA
jgi:PAS domain S-box-containing protein